VSRIAGNRAVDRTSTTALRAMGISLSVPRGWDATISVLADADGDDEGDVREEVHCPFVHVATVALPRVRGHYGAGVVELLGAADAFATLVEFGPEAAGTRLFANRGLPRRLGANGFSPSVLQRRLRGQLGSQAFFQEAGRPFCLYAVLGGDEARTAALTELNGVLRTISVDRLGVR